MSSKTQTVKFHQPCFPKHIILILIIVLIATFSICQFITKIDHSTIQESVTKDLALLKEVDRGLNISEIFSNYIHKNYSLLKKSPKNLIMIYLVGIEGTGNHFFGELFSNWISYNKMKTDNYMKDKHYFYRADPLHRMIHNNYLSLSI